MFGGRRKADIDNILIVEDEALVAFDNERFLMDSGYHVVATLDNAAAAIAALDRQTVGLVLTDLSLRGEGDGRDVARAAAATGVPTLIVSGSSVVEPVAGAVGRLDKPYSDRDLLAAIEAVADRLGGRAVKPMPKLTFFEPAA